MSGKQKLESHRVHALALFYSSSMLNILLQAVQDSSVNMYADDTSLCQQSHDLTQLHEAINSELIKLETWLQGSKVSLNVAKTHAMLLSAKHKRNSLQSQNETLELTMCDNELEVVHKTKCLGVQIICLLYWKGKLRQFLLKSPGRSAF